MRRFLALGMALIATLLAGCNDSDSHSAVARQSLKNWLDPELRYNVHLQIYTDGKLDVDQAWVMANGSRQSQDTMRKVLLKGELCSTGDFRVEGQLGTAIRLEANNVGKDRIWLEYHFESSRLEENGGKCIDGRVVPLLNTTDGGSVISLTSGVPVQVLATTDGSGAEKLRVVLTATKLD
ncbi:hypothetical protein HNP46_006535 [Pseudomonas nitritireducens]|uniref:Lipoprotein n=1 Tax=Pseudomonas nitroreducens TaxID=46680 RepID=A0A7W7P4E1_PSENT|nr:hypothetical protein [Pseudomonas nitritireducens]MBB4867621.1 hypothetical protein [Pseudomonas nitritireducens]